MVLTRVSGNVLVPVLACARTRTRRLSLCRSQRSRVWAVVERRWGGAAGRVCCLDWCRRWAGQEVASLFGLSSLSPLSLSVATWPQPLFFPFAPPWPYIACDQDIHVPGDAKSMFAGGVRDGAGATGRFVCYSQHLGCPGRTSLASVCFGVWGFRVPGVWRLWWCGGLCVCARLVDWDCSLFAPSCCVSPLLWCADA